MRCGRVDRVEVTNSGSTRYETTTDCKLTVEMTVDKEYLPDIFEALSDEPVSRLLGKRLATAEAYRKGYTLQCGNCGLVFSVDERVNYCPKCGAKFDSEVD